MDFFSANGVKNRTI